MNRKDGILYNDECAILLNDKQIRFDQPWISAGTPESPPAQRKYLVLLQQLHHGVAHEQHVGLLVLAVQDESAVLEGRRRAA